MTDAFLIAPRGEPRRLATAVDAAIIKGMLLRGDPIHQVAAHFDCNSGRIAETKRPFLRRSVQHPPRFKDVSPAPLHLLPPPGPPAPTSIEITGIADEFRREQQRTNEKLDHVLRQLAAFGRRIGLIEPPKPPRITRRKPMEA